MRTSVGGVTHEIPVIDIGPFLAGGDGQAAADAIEAAATQVGFFQVINHGVPGELLDAVYAAAYEFSDLPADVKLRAASPHPYRGVHLRPDQQGAIRFERFLAARYDNADAAIAAARREIRPKASASTTYDSSQCMLGTSHATVATSIARNA